MPVRRRVRMVRWRRCRPGQSFTVPTLSAGVVVSLQGDSGFQYTLTPSTPPTGEPTSHDGQQPPATDGQPTGSSVLATWNCTGSPCPWGNQSTSQAAVWPAAAEPTRARHGYTVSHDVYAAAAKVVGWKVTVTAGNASVYAGTPSGSHGPLASLSAGQSFTVPTLSAGVVVSLQDDSGFQYTLTPSTPPTSEPTGQPTSPTGSHGHRPAATVTDWQPRSPTAANRSPTAATVSRPVRRCWRRGIAPGPRVRGAISRAVRRRSGRLQPSPAGPGMGTPFRMMYTPRRKGGRVEGDCDRRERLGVCRHPERFARPVGDVVGGSELHRADAGARV